LPPRRRCEKRASLRASEASGLGGFVEQRGDCSDKATSRFDRFLCLRQRHDGFRPDFIIGNGLQIVGQPQEMSELIRETWLIPGPFEELTVNPFVGFSLFCRVRSKINAWAA
jgi:hypothetical protein